ncbi:MAG TPA: glycosyltransferase family 2 protein [Verrucomicrobia bacterium]|nr:glycosyltransferase family 2 protein [Verrucomicrobiota bacterium]HOP99197.1 glycosyltransferase family 2 protein [Verrucomicrobiota bacterium]HPU57701.1 glycosyltransferase family 2 protein [Verrucomicrobiota bacterium]
MDASIIVVTRNTRVLTCAAIASVRAGAGALRVQVIAVDNASTDGTAEAIAKEFPEVECIRSESNLGFARAVNLAAKRARGEFIVLLNSDARLKDDALPAAIEWMRANPGAGIAGGQLLNKDGSRQNSIANLPSLATELLNKSLLRWLFPRRYPGKAQVYSAPVQVPSIIGAFFVIRRGVWEAVGGLDDRYFFFFEETDFCLQARRRGWGVFHLPQVQIWHEQGGSARKTNAAARIEYWRSRYAYFRKNHSLAERAALRIGLVCRLIVNLLVALFINALTLGRAPKWRDRLAAMWAVAWWHLRGCPEHMGLPR